MGVDDSNKSGVSTTGGAEGGGGGGAGTFGVFALIGGLTTRRGGRSGDVNKQAGQLDAIAAGMGRADETGASRGAGAEGAKAEGEEAGAEERPMASATGVTAPASMLSRFPPAGGSRQTKSISLSIRTCAIRARRLLSLSMTDSL